MDSAAGKGEIGDHFAGRSSAVEPCRAPAHNLPAQPTPLLGRADDILRARQALLRDDVRLLTLTGPAGVGKTRLALGVADCVLDLFADGVYFVDLACIDEPALVTPTIAETLGVSATEDQGVLAALTSFFRDRSMLLVLDNFEHLLPAADQLAALLSVCTSIKIVATSRATLRLRWEHSLRVAPLTLPEPQAEKGPLAAAAESFAVQLFVERARAVLPNFELTVDNVATITDLCRRLDGLPLAIELAAARIAVLSPKAMLARLGRRFDLLVDGAQDLPDRHRTLRGALDYGFNLLGPEEQALLCRLGLFVGGCTAEAATALEPAAEDPLRLAFGTLNRLDSLLQKSLLQVTPQSDGQVRFHMLETVRGYALERLTEKGELEAVRERWIEYHRALTERASTALGQTQGEWLDVLDREQTNLRAVLRWCIDTGDALRGLELASNLWRFWLLREHITEGRLWLAEVLDMPLAAAPTPMRARALSAAGELAFYEGDNSRAEALQRESLALYRALEDRRGIAAGLDKLGRLIAHHGDAVRGLAFLEESLSVERELDDTSGLAEVLHDLGDLATEQGQTASARSRYEESLLHWHALGDAVSVASVFESMAILAQSQGLGVRALRLAGASAVLREGLRTSSSTPAQRLRLQQSLELAEIGLGHEDATRAVDEGRAMRLDAAVTYARTVDDPRASEALSSPASTTEKPPLPSEIHLPGLTAREREVAAQLLRGMSNRQIAEELVITERTAETHVCRILGKLGLGSRAQLAALIMDQQLASRTVRQVGVGHGSERRPPHAALG